jgi:predicted nucleic acid-binding protein
MTECVLDAYILIAALDNRDAQHSKAAASLRRMLAEGDRLVLSVVNYAEVLVRPAGDRATLNAAVAAIDALGIELVAPSAADAREVAILRNSGLALPDAFALATALTRNAPLATFDRGVRTAARAAGAGLVPART